MALVVKKKNHVPASKRTRAQKNVPVSQFRWGESYVSLLLGIFVVVIAAVAFVFVAKHKKIQETSSLRTIAPFVQQQVSSRVLSNTPTPPSVLPDLPVAGGQHYTVKKGDDLWSIAAKVYHDGYRWVDIAKANNLDNPGAIFAGNELIIPTVIPSGIQTTTPTPTVASQLGKFLSPTPGFKANKTPGNYTVQKGDDLWSIAVKVYHDGYRWVDIAKANDLDNPGVIYSGNVLKLPQ